MWKFKLVNISLFDCDVLRGRGNYFQKRPHKGKEKKIFIDCGAWEGSSIKAFKRHYENSDDYIIYAFECEPRLRKSMKSLSNKYKFRFIDKAVWISNDSIQLYPGKGKYTQSGSVIASKKKYIDKENPIIVDAVDFSQWIMDNFHKDSYMICKMNIEGAEYDVLEKMIKDGSIKYINKLYVAFHYRKIEGISEHRHNKIRNQIENITELKGYNLEKEEENPF